MRILVLIIALFMVSVSAKAEAERVVYAGNTALSPLDIVKSLYAPYLGQGRPQLNSVYPQAKDGWGGALADIQQHASQRLRTLLERERKCQKERPGEYCTITSDVIINGQDYDDLQLSIQTKQLSPEKQTIDVRLYEKYDATVRYFFVLEEGIWKIDDVWNSGGEKGMLLSEQLAGN